MASDYRGAPEQREAAPINFAGHVEACGHRVRFWYDLLMMENVTLTDDDRFELREHAEERAREMIADGYVAGQLCFCGQNDDGDGADFWGAWAIESAASE